MMPLNTVLVAGLQYLIHPTKLGSIQETINSDAILPVTLLTTEEIFGDIDGVLKLLDSYDDVFSPDFGGVLVEKPGSGAASNKVSSKGGLNLQVYHLDDITASGNDWSDLPSGPYFLHGPNLHQAWRLYDDEFGAFAFGVIPEDTNQPTQFQVLTSLSPQGDFKSIAVPSRLYHPRPSVRKPLSGARISISDLVSLSGTPSSLSSRSWKAIHTSTSDTTADFVQGLIELGAIIVGKTKAPPLGTGTDWIDEQAPWSARGDGYQIVPGLSPGNSASLVGYDWLQYSIGGNEDGTSAQNGVYALSPSSGSISLDGVMNISKSDNVGLGSRSLEELLDLATASLKITPGKASLPNRIIYPVDMHNFNFQKSHSDDLVSKLETFLGVSAEKISIQDIWDKDPPAEAHGEGFLSYMVDVPIYVWCYEYAHGFNDFRSQYIKKFEKMPYFEATSQMFWHEGISISDEQYQEYLVRLTVFRQWFDKHVMALNSTAPNPDAIMILPCGASHIPHRDEDTVTPIMPRGVRPEILATILGAPLLSVPFVQIPYQSRISGTKEYKPVCAALMGTRGSEDGMIQLVKQAFEKVHWQTRVNTGRFTFPLKGESDTKDNNSPGISAQSPSDEL